MRNNKTVAYAWRNGVIEFGSRCPNGAIPIASSEDKDKLVTAVSGLARLAYDNKTLLVPFNFPRHELRSFNDFVAIEQLAAFAAFVKRSLEGRPLAPLNFDYDLQVWVKDGICQDCNHPVADQAAGCCSQHRFQGLKIQEARRLYGKA